MSKLSRRLSSALCLMSNASTWTLSSDSTNVGSSSKTSIIKDHNPSDDGLPSYDEATLKGDEKSDMFSMLSKKSQKEVDQKKMTIEDVLNIEKPSGYKRWLKSAFSSEYQQVQAVKQELEALRKFDIIIIVDDSTSMKGDRWTTACEALGKLADAAMIYDEDGVDVYFLNDPTTKGEGLKCSDDVKALFAEVQPSFGTPIGRRLKELTKLYLEQLWQAHENKSTVKPRNYIVITDGVPTSKPEVVEAIQNMCTKLVQFNCPQDQLGIQFIQVGTSRSAASFLRELDDDEGLKKFPRDIVDASPYTVGESLTAEHILKVMKGAIDRRIDNKGSV